MAGIAGRYRHGVGKDANPVIWAARLVIIHPCRGRVELMKAAM
jgi:hypothetical protein